MSAYLSLAVAVVGAAFYFMSSRPKVSDLGRISFAAGLLAFLMLNGTRVVGLMK